MNRIATTLCIALGLAVATSAMALDLHQHPVMPPAQRAVHLLSASIATGCDDGVTWSGWYQNTDDRLGNTFNFGTGAILSSVDFVHYDWGNAGPFAYDLEVWDPASCTLVAGKYGLVAADVPNTNVTESVDMCSAGIHVAGTMVVAINPNTCVSATDCYPDLVFDDQMNVQCPVIINNASTSPACNDLSPYGGPFLLRVGVNNCVVPTRRDSWGQLKSIYR